MTAPTASCWFCESPAVDGCPRCRRPRCVQHGSEKKPKTWPKIAYKTPDLCPICAEATTRRGRKAGHLAVVTGAGLVGTAVSALAVMVLGGAIGLDVQFTVLGMLLAEVLGGGLSAYAADRQVRRWLVGRDRRQLATNLPPARLLPR